MWFGCAFLIFFVPVIDGQKMENIADFFAKGANGKIFADNSTEYKVVNTSKFTTKPLDLLLAEKQFCQQGYLESCLKYKLLKFIDDLARPVSQLSTSDWIQIGRSFEDNKLLPTPRLVGLPVRAENVTLDLFGGKYFGKGLQFMEAQLARFLSFHGVVFPVEIFDEEGSVDKFLQPVLLEPQNRESRASRGKVKRKSVVFPLLVLFKFFKIKMLLLPILLSVLFIKKILIFFMAFGPTLFGILRFLRAQGGFGGFGGFTPPFAFGPANLVSEVADVRGEFSTINPSYLPYNRDFYRQRDTRYSGESVRPIDSNSLAGEY